MKHMCLHRISQVYWLWLRDQQMSEATLTEAVSETITSPWSSGASIQRHPSCSAGASSGTAQTQTESLWFHVYIIFTSISFKCLVYLQFFHPQGFL